MVRQGGRMAAGVSRMIAEHTKVGTTTDSLTRYAARARLSDGITPPIAATRILELHQAGLVVISRSGGLRLPAPDASLLLRRREACR